VRLRAEGVTATEATDARLVRLIRMASQYVDRMTGRFFEPRPMTLTVDGSGGRAQLLSHPIIGVREASSSPPSPPNSASCRSRRRPSASTTATRPRSSWIPTTVRTRGSSSSTSDLLGGQAAPASLGLGSLVWPRGAQNVVIDGLFGYTDPDGSPVGRTPTLIRHVTKLLALRELPALTDIARREDRQKRWRLVSERTRDQGYNLGSSPNSTPRRPWQTPTARAR
jgi:ribosome modulation factor